MAKRATAVLEEPVPRPPALMHPDVQFLLAVQVDDIELYALEDRLASLAPRIAALEKERGKVAAQLDRARASIAAEETRHREAQLRVDANRALVERSQRAYESVTSPKEANAAIVQLEQTKRMVDDSERDAPQVQGRINELRHHVADLEGSLDEVEGRQATTRAALETERQSIEARLPGRGEARNATHGDQAVPARDALQVRSRAGAQAQRVRVSAPRTVVQRVRHGDPDAASRGDGGHRIARDVRRVRRAPVCGRMTSR